MLKLGRVRERGYRATVLLVVRRAAVLKQRRTGHAMRATGVLLVVRRAAVLKREWGYDGDDLGASAARREASGRVET